MPRKFTPEQKQNLLDNLDIEGNVSLPARPPPPLSLKPQKKISQSHIALANSNHGS